MDERIVRLHNMMRGINPEIILNANNLMPDRIDEFRAQLIDQMQLDSPAIFDDTNHMIVLQALVDYMMPDASASTTPRYRSGKTPLDSHPQETPFAHYIHGEPFHQISERDEHAWRDSVSTYLVLDAFLKQNHQHDFLNDVIAEFKYQGIQPDAPVLFDALSPLTGISGYDMTVILSNQGVTGIANALGVSQSYTQDAQALTAHTIQDNIPVNDILNWLAGRAQPGMEYASIDEKIAVGLEARLDATINTFRQLAHQKGIIPQTDAERQEALDVSTLFDLLPPVLSTLFFEMNGSVIYTHGKTLGNAFSDVGDDLDGFSELRIPEGAPHHAINPIYVAIGSPDAERVFIHELHHLMLPEQIPLEDAYYADALIKMDDIHITQLKLLVDDYVRSYDEYGSMVNPALNAQTMATLSAMTAPNGLSFQDAINAITADNPMAVFVQGVNEAYDYLRLGSEAYMQSDMYQDPVTQVKELIPRYSELRYYEHPDERNMLGFITPGMTEIYSGIYLPHLQRQLNEIHAEHGSRAQAMMYGRDLTQQEEHALEAAMNATHPHDPNDPRFLSDDELFEHATITQSYGRELTEDELSELQMIDYAANQPTTYIDEYSQNHERVGAPQQVQAL